MAISTGVYRRLWQPPQRRHFAPKSPNASVSLTGVAGTGQVGSLTPSFPIQRPSIFGVQANTFPSNYAPNPSGTGLTPGTIGSGGVMPSGWAASTFSDGLTWEVSVGATYVVNGLSIPTVRMRLHGTATSAAAAAVYYVIGSTFGGLTFGQIGCQSAYVKVVAGDYTNIQRSAQWGQIFDSTSSGVVDNQPTVTFTSSFTQYSTTNTVPSSGNAPFSWPQAAFIFYPNLAAIDLTIDIGAPQLVYGSSPVSLQPTTPSVSATITGVAATGQVAALSGGTFSRSSTATYLDAGGNLISVGNDVLRPNYSGGVATGALIEAAATNSLRNNTMVGAVVGTPGTLPTDWGYNGSNQGTIAGSVVGKSTSNGISYVDIRFNGTSSGAGFYQVFFETSNGIAASVGQTWTISSYLTIVSGSTANITAIQFGQNENSVAPAFLTSGVSTIVVGSGSLSTQRYSYTYTTTNGSTAFIDPLYSVSFGSGAVVDITIRVGMPQMELGSSATSVITTSGATVTRAADTVSTAGIPLIMEPLGATPITMIGTASGKAVSSIVITLPSNVPAGCTIFVAVAIAGNHTVNISDSFGQTNWVGGNGQAAANVTTILDWAWNASAMNAGNTITVSAPSGTLTMAASAFYATGLYAASNPFDNSGGSSGTSTSPSITSATSTFTGDLIVASLATDGPSTDTFTQDSHYASFTRVGTTGGSDITAAGGTLNSQTTAGSTYAPTITSRDWAGYVASFRVVTAQAGVQATGQVGTLTPALDDSASLTGVAGTGRVGTVTAQDQKTITGVAGTGQVGTLTPALDDSATLTGVAGTGQVGTLHAEIDKAITGVAGTGQVGSFVSEIDKSITGVAGTGQVGTLTTQINDSASLTGVSATGQVGSLKAEIDASVTGVSGTGQVSSVTAQNQKLLTGVSGTGQVGSLVSEIDHSITGVAGTGQVGTLLAEIDKSILGVAGTGQVGTFTTETDASLTGVSATGQVSSVTAQDQKLLTGVAGTGQVGTLAGEIDKSIVGVSATGQVGTLAIEIDARLVGVAGIGQVGILSTSGAQNATISGVEAVGQVGTLQTEIDVSTIGVEATGQVGTLAGEIDVSIIGVEATGEVGTLTVSTSGNVDAHITGVQGIGQVGTLAVSTGEVAAPVTGSGEDARQKYLEWKRQQRAKRKEALKPPAPRKTPEQPQVPASQPKLHILPEDAATLLLAKNLENQRAQQAKLDSIDAELIDGIVGQEQQDRDDEEAITLLLLSSI